MSRNEENERILGVLMEALPEEVDDLTLDSIHLGMIMGILADISKSLAIICDKMSENRGDVDFMCEALESRIWELGEELKDADAFNPTTAYNQGKKDAFSSVLCALRGKEEESE